MAVTYPRELPTAGLNSGRLVDCTFSLVEGVSLSRNESGRAVAAVEFADAYLRARFETPPMRREHRAAWEAWRASLRGGLKSFLSWDRSRPELIAYPGGVPEIVASSWDGTGTLSALAANLVTVAGTPTGFTMSEGDLLGLVESGRRAVFFVTETVTRGVSTIAVPVDPPVPPVFTTAATAVLYRPKAEFILLPDTWSAPRADYNGKVSFEAVQKI